MKTEPSIQQQPPKEEPLKFKTALGKAVGARLLEKEPEAFQRMLGEVGKSILLAAGAHLSNELAKLAVVGNVGDDDEQLNTLLFYNGQCEITTIPVSFKKVTFV